MGKGKGTFGAEWHNGCKDHAKVQRPVIFIKTNKSDKQ